MEGLGRDLIAIIGLVQGSRTVQEPPCLVSRLLAYTAALRIPRRYFGTCVGHPSDGPGRCSGFDVKEANAVEHLNLGRA